MAKKLNPPIISLTKINELNQKFWERKNREYDFLYKKLPAIGIVRDQKRIGKNIVADISFNENEKDNIDIWDNSVRNVSLIEALKPQIKNWVDIFIGGDIVEGNTNNTTQTNTKKTNTKKTNTIPIDITKRVKRKFSLEE